MKDIGWEKFRGRKIMVRLLRNNGYEIGDGIVRVWPFTLRCLYEAQDEGSCESIFGELKVRYEGRQRSTLFDAYAIG